MAGAVDDAHAAATQLGEDLVAGHDAGKRCRLRWAVRLAQGKVELKLHLKGRAVGGKALLILGQHRRFTVLLAKEILVPQKLEDGQRVVSESGLFDEKGFDQGPFTGPPALPLLFAEAFQVAVAVKGREGWKFANRFFAGCRAMEEIERPRGVARTKIGHFAPSSRGGGRKEPVVVESVVHDCQRQAFPLGEKG
jgi:hypothetical protein